MNQQQRLEAAQEITEAREGQGMSAAALAKEAGISETTMTKITNGIPVRASSLRKVREVLGIAPLTQAQAEAGYPPDVQLVRDAIGMWLVGVPEGERAERVRDLFRAIVGHEPE